MPASQDQDQDQDRDQDPDTSPPTPPPAAGGLSGKRVKGAGRKTPPEKLAKAGYASAWAEGISSATGHPCTTPPAGDLGRIAAAHAKYPDGSCLEGADLLRWFRDTAADFARWALAQPAKRKRTIHEYRMWLDSGHPAPESSPMPVVAPGVVEKFREYWTSTYAAAPMQYGPYPEADTETSREAYSQLLAVAERHSADDNHPGKGAYWAKHWVDSYLADPDPFFAKSRHSFATLLWVTREQPARWGKPGSKPKAAQAWQKPPTGNHREPLQTGAVAGSMVDD